MKTRISISSPFKLNGVSLEFLAQIMEAAGISDLKILGYEQGEAGLVITVNREVTPEEIEAVKQVFAANTIQIAQLA